MGEFIGKSIYPGEYIFMILCDKMDMQSNLNWWSYGNIEYIEYITTWNIKVYK